MTFEPGWSRLIVWVDAMSDDATPCPRSGTTVPCGGWIVARVSTVEAIMHRAFGEVVAGPEAAVDQVCRPVADHGTTSSLSVGRSPGQDGWMDSSRFRHHGNR